MNASYGLNYSENSASIMLKSSSLGFTGALSLSWNLFKGMSHKKELEKSKLLIEANEGKKKEAELALEREFLDLYERLQVNIELLKLEKQNIKTADLNLKRSKELYFNGTLNNVQFRQAQINLLIAQSKLNNLKYQAKLQEFQVLRLSDQLIN
jgi:outer membrane protein